MTKLSRSGLLAAVLLLTACNGTHGPSTVATSPSGRGFISERKATPGPSGTAQQASDKTTPLHKANVGQRLVFISPVKIGSLIGLDTARNRALRIQGVHLSSWAATKMAHRRIINPQIDQNREVYEVTTTFNSPYWVQGNEWLSGTRVYIVDAVTGQVYFSLTSGNQIRRSRPSTHSRSSLVLKSR